MIPATSVEEEEVVNFHSDLQRPFLRNQQKVIFFFSSLFQDLNRVHISRQMKQGL